MVLPASAMRVSTFYLHTLKEAPAEAEVASQQLMLRAGLIKKVSSGIYSWLPLGLLTLRKVEQVVREEMNRAGALETYLPHVLPAELWEETGRWDKFGPLLLKGDVVRRPVSYADGAILALDGPGLGVDIDETALNECARR